MPFFKPQGQPTAPSPFGDNSVFNNKGILGEQPDPSQAMGLALLNAMQQQQAAGMQRTATPLGSIANNLMPLFGAMVQAHALQAQGQRQALLDKIQLLNAMKGSAGDSPEMKAAKLADLTAATGLKVAQTEATKNKPDKSPTSNDLLMGSVPGSPNYDPLLAAAYDKQQKDKLEQLKLAGGIAELQKGNLLDQKAARDEQARLDAPATKALKGGQIIFNTQDLSNPKAISQKDFEEGPYIAVPPKSAQIVRGAKLIQSQLDEIRPLITEILPKSRWQIANPLYHSELEAGENSRNVQRLKTLGQLESMLGVKNFVAERGPNQTEIKNIGHIDPHTDSQDTALGKVDAMQSLVDKELSGMGLDPGALRAKPKDPLSGMGEDTSGAAPDTSGAAATPTTTEFDTMIKGLIQRGATNDQLRTAAKRYKESHPDAVINVELR